MRMRKFDETLIEEGMVIKVKLTNGKIKTGVVHTCGSIGFGGPIVQCNQQGGLGFTLFSPFSDVESFAILKKHPTVHKFGGRWGEWDYLSNHINMQGELC